MMGIHKLTAGDGYLYLIRQTAAADSDKGRSSLGDYYSAKGESPGHDDRVTVLQIVGVVPEKFDLLPGNLLQRPIGIVVTI